MFKLSHMWSVRDLSSLFLCPLARTPFIFDCFFPILYEELAQADLVHVLPRT